MREKRLRRIIREELREHDQLRAARQAAGLDGLRRKYELNAARRRYELRWMRLKLDADLLGLRAGDVEPKERFH